MDARSRRRIEMGTGVREFHRGRPDSDAGQTASLGQLNGLLDRGEKAATAQREAEVDSRTASTRKEQLRQAMLAGPIAHLAGVGRIAARQHAELGKAFQARPGLGTYLVFASAARTMLAAAESSKEVLVECGMSEAVLAQFGRMLDEFDAAMLLGTTARNAHKGATRELHEVAIQIGQVVRVMDARNRQRFENDPQALGSWLSAKQVRGTPKPVAPGSGAGPVSPGPAAGEGAAAGGEARPAA